MTKFASVGLSMLALFAAPLLAQQAEPGTGSAQVAPASAAPQTEVEPNLRTDSKPHTYASPATDSGPPPETLGPGQQIPPDMGLDYSALPEGFEDRGYTEVFSDKGVKRRVEKPAKVFPVVNPPEPLSKILPAPPEPPVRHMPTPPSPAPPVTTP